MKNIFLRERKKEVDGLFNILSQSKDKNEFFMNVRERKGFKSLAFFVKTMKAFNTRLDIKNFILLSLPGLVSWFVSLVLFTVFFTGLIFHSNINLWLLAFAIILIFTGRNCLAETNNFYIWFRPLENFTLDKFKVYLLKENGIIEKETILESIAQKDELQPTRKRI